MTSLFSRKIFWVLVCCLALAILGLALLFYYPDNVISSKEKEKSISGNLQEQLQVQSSQGNNQTKDKEIQEKPPKSLKETSEKQSGPATIHPKVDSLDHIMPPSESSDPLFAALIEQVTQDVIKDYELQFTKTESKLEKTKTTFKEVFNNQEGNKTNKLMTLIREADEEEKVWIREELIKRFNSDPDPGIRRACLVCITMFRDVAREVLAYALTSDSDRGVQKVAAYALGQSGSEQEVDALLQAIKEDKGVWGRGRDIAMVAVASLGEIGGEQAAFALTEIWDNKDLSRGCREQTLVALGMVGDPASLKTFEAVLQGKEDLIRDNAASGLGRLVRKNQENPQVVGKAINLLRNYVNDENPKVRRNIVDALGWIGDSGDIYLIQPLLGDNYSTIVNYTEDGELKEKVVYPIREKAKEAIDKINARLASRE